MEITEPTYLITLQEHVKPAGSPFTGIISKCFEQHLNIYIDSQDKYVILISESVWLNYMHY